MHFQRSIDRCRWSTMHHEDKCISALVVLLSFLLSNSNSIEYHMYHCYCYQLFQNILLSLYTVISESDKAKNEFTSNFSQWWRFSSNTLFTFTIQWRYTTIETFETIQFHGCRKWFRSTSCLHINLCKKY